MPAAHIFSVSSAPCLPPRKIIGVLAHLSSTSTVPKLFNLRVENGPGKAMAAGRSPARRRRHGPASPSVGRACTAAAGPRGPTTIAASPAGAASASGGYEDGWEEEARREMDELDRTAEELQSRAPPDEESDPQGGEGAGRKEGEGEADVRFGAKGYKQAKLAGHSKLQPVLDKSPRLDLR